MFLRTVKAAGGKGVQHEYVRLVESYREHGKNKQRVVWNLGRKDLLAGHVDALIRLLRGEGGRTARAGDVEATGAWDWGPLLVARTLWREVGLEAILDRLSGRGAPDGAALVGLNRRRNEAGARYLERATGPWIECPPARTAPERNAAPRTFVQEVPAEQRQVRAELEALERRVQRGKLKAAAKIGAAAARILGRHHGHRYYDWEYADGGFRCFEHPVHLRREEALEGTYVLQTTEPQLTPLQAVALYKGLSEVERAFAHLKDLIAMRPIYHQTDRRVEAHIFVAALAFLLHRALEKKLKAAGLDLSATEALQALRTVRVVDFQLGNGQTKRSVTRGTARASGILAALGITELDPPTPPKEARTVA